MRETERIADQLRRAAEGEAWHGPSLRDLLADVDAGRAATRGILGGHTIWEIVLHVTVWRDTVRKRLEEPDGEYPYPLGEEDWPIPPEPGEAAWREAIERMEASGRALRAAIEALPDSRLDQPIREGKGSVYHHLHGVVQHDLYHAGQIAVLKRALGMGLQV